MQTTKYWMVHRLGHGAPVVEHPSEHLAADVAMRLARKFVGETFVLLEAKRACCAQDPITWEECQ